MNKKILISLVFFAFLINIVSAGYWEESYNVDLVNYFKLDEGSGSTVIDAHENINGTQTNANQGVAGKINTAYNLSASDSAYISYPNDFQNSDNLGSFSFWWYTEKEACSNSPLWSSSRSGASELIRVFPTSSCQMQIQHYENPGGINDAVNGNVTFANDTWYYVVFQSDGSDWYLYVNGYPANLSIAVGSNTGAWLNDLSSVQSVGFGREFIGTANYGNVYLDEVAYWSRVINNTEILNIYNEGYGISYNQTVPAGSPNITLNSPPNNYVSSSSSIIFNVTVTDQIKVDNVSIYLDGVLNETNSSGINGTYLFSKSFLDGSYNWSIIAWNNNSLNNTSFTRDFIIDTIDPSIDVDSPQGQLDYLIQDYNMTLNFTATDNNLEDCVWIYNGSSTIIPCSNDTLTTYYFNYEVGENNGTLFVNDSAGRSNTYAVNWTYSVLENFVNYSEVTFETATED